MKTAVGLIATTIFTATVATGASAEWRLYVNRDNKTWSLERAYVSNDECDRAARTLYRSGQALGVGCAEYPAPNSAQAPTPRPAEYTRSASTIERQVARSYETPRSSVSRSSAPRVTEYQVRPSIPRPAAAAESHPAAVIFPPSGGIELRDEDKPRAAAVSQPAPQPHRHAAPAPRNAVASPGADEDKNSAAMMLARAATEASAASAREAVAETAKREAAVTADKAERRTTLAVFAGVMIVIMTGVAYSVYRVARTSPLRALATGFIEIGVLTAALAYPVVEMWTRLRISESTVLSWMPGLLAGIVIAGVGVIVLALDLTRKPARPSSTGAPARDAERKPQAPVELIKPGEQVKISEPARPVEPAEPVKPPQPIRSLEPVSFLEAPRAAAPETPRWAAVKASEAPRPVEPVKAAEPARAFEHAKPIDPPKWAAVKATDPPSAVEPVKAIEPVKANEPAKPHDAAKPVEPPRWVAIKSAEAPNPEPVKPVEAAKPVEPVKPVESVKPPEPVQPVEIVRSVEVAEPVDGVKPVVLVKPVDEAKQVDAGKPVEAEKPAEPVTPSEKAAPVAGGS